MAARSELCAAAVLLISSVILQGCGGGGGSDSTTTFAPATTTATTTSTTVTTQTGPGTCFGQDTSKIYDDAKPVLCFCFYTGGCLDHFKCRDDEALEYCQRRYCGVMPVEVDSMATSFFDVKHSNDLLTIPSLWYKDILEMTQVCEDDKGQKNLEMLLQTGRDAYVKHGGSSQPPEWQCVHLPGHVAVGWLHVHNFIGSVGGEKLPGVPPLASCARATLSVPDAAGQILAQAQTHMKELASNESVLQV